MATRSQTKIRIIPIAILIVSLLWLWFPGGKLEAASGVTVTSYSVNPSGAIEALDSVVVTVNFTNTSGSTITGAHIILDSNCSFYSTEASGFDKNIGD